MTIRTMTLVVLLASLAVPGALEAQRRGNARSSNERYPCESWGRRNQQRHCEEREMGMRPMRGPLTIDAGANGGVSVIGWDRDSIHVIAHIQANGDTQEEARATAGEIRIAVSGSEIRADGPSAWRRNSPQWVVSYEVFAPRRTDLALTSVNGPVEVMEVSGTMRLQTENGPITLEGTGGDIQARATNGPLSIELTGTRWEGTGLDAETVNGPVHLEIPSTYSARLETGTVNGPMDLNTPMTVTFQGRRYSRITSMLGSGGATVRAVTTNGPVAIRRD